MHYGEKVWGQKQLFEQALRDDELNTAKIADIRAELVTIVELFLILKHSLLK